jgi:aldehyde:ferredoxin oxidoreductase
VPFGYNGKILYVNLTTKKITVETPTQKFYRKYLGGSALEHTTVSGIYLSTPIL